MKKLLFGLLACFSLSLAGQDYQIVIHGGAGNGLREASMAPELVEAYHRSLAQALSRGGEVLDQGGSATEAVVAVLSFMEDDSLYNAGRGAVLTYEGQPSLDASLMRGNDLAAGAVCNLARIRHPIQAAEAVLHHSDHVLLSGSGAEQFAILQKLEAVEPDYFITAKSKAALRRLRARSEAPAQKGPAKMGTVGCVVRDAQGHIAAGTSTGGMNGKRYGRIGDSPLIGAGTYANDQSLGVSCTGHGEYFIRYAVAYDLHARYYYQSQKAQAAADQIIHQVLAPAGGQGGLIALSKEGEIVMSFNTNGMLRGYLRQGEEPYTAIFK